ncbi:uncharacterized protein AMSG_02385 [Thecamonas trahens ATCC 50062]|uniref:MICOS complex subunit MIC10 n=1 Tax=Thecamonas trahens ATCC 50062 TaxID=461836 RepID=A0A0L0DVR9_THETB|nr:hypothetical protein AMSG_02385 [Thecamonas trahens ATCC 50062]KNC56414.1 hypothetical protein AMSG_02385 [Thecamonas trahens ATCC 50062]|eukprot:XP_013760927.1 hypothetical protein AMSG_02385 [Thecamonas trahens ATCC 50062]
MAEQDANAKFDRCAENAIVNTAVGTVGGLAVGVTLLRGHRLLRMAAIGVGIGMGVGMAWSNCSYDFNNPGITHGTVIRKADAS